MNIGIDKIGFFVPPTALDMETLAVARGVEQLNTRLELASLQWQ